GVWQRLATDLKPRHLAGLSRKVAFADLPQIFPEFIAGRAKGRIVVEIGGEAHG
ncbi:MAG TPA: oxidoreductase, partial [Rhodocyclaceae bacterium]|nr:oxidoreductase [Rhodocyclaceae bacterium]